MATLRRACRACTRSKRRCIVRLPKCSRCLQKGLDCTYDLEPLVTEKSSLKESYAISCLSLDQPGFCILRSVESSNNGADPAVGVPGQPHTLELIRLGYRSVPDSLGMGRPSVFIHPDLSHGAPGSAYLDAFTEQRTTAAVQHHVEHLLRLDYSRLDIYKALPALQVLLLYAGTNMLSPSRSKWHSVQRCMPIIYSWTQTLLQSAQEPRPRSHSPWQEWLFGESLRRTIIMSYLLLMTTDIYTYGYCSHWLFLESLPFDARPGLWMARSAQAWMAKAGARVGSEVGEALGSFHEVATGGRGGDVGEDMFLGLVEASHNGLRRGGRPGGG